MLWKELPHRLNLLLFLEQILNKIKGTWSIDSFVMLNRLLVALVESIELTLISPECVITAVLLFDELICLDIGGEECILLCEIASLCDLTEGASEFVLTVLAGNIAAVARHLCSVIYLTHVKNYL
jgi:hypothetical protein